MRVRPIPVGLYESSSRHDVIYTVALNPDGTVSCDCPAWRFKKPNKDRWCKHVEEYYLSEEKPDYFRMAMKAAIKRVGVA